MGKFDVAARAHALANRCRLGMMVAANTKNVANYHYFRGGLDQLEDLFGNLAQALAVRDAQSGGYQPPTSLQASWAALPVSLKNMSMAQMQQHLHAHAPDFT